MPRSRASERVGSIAIVVSAAIAAALVLWRLWPSEPAPPVSLPPADRARDQAPRAETGPGI